MFLPRHYNNHPYLIDPNNPIKSQETVNRLPTDYLNYDMGAYLLPGAPPLNGWDVNLQTHNPNGTWQLSGWI